MSHRLHTLLIGIVLLTTVVRPVRADVTAEGVRDGIENGIAYLKSQQNKVNGRWSDTERFPGGVTALCTLALLNAGVDKKDPTIQRALNSLRSLDRKHTYVVSLQTMVFCLVEPENRLLIAENVKWLQNAQIKTGDRRGTWSYSNSGTGGDNSNTQFAMLALHEAQRVGVEVSEQTWRFSLTYWLKQQKEDGSWGYMPGQPTKASMTCAGIASVVIASENLPEHRGESRLAEGGVLCCGRTVDNDAVQQGLQWLGKYFFVERNYTPATGAGGNAGHLLYYLYAVERVGRLTGHRFFYNGTVGKDWYRQGAEHLLKLQDTTRGYWVGVGLGERDRYIATSFALLFLSKGRRPVLIARLKHGKVGFSGKDEDWNHHRKGLHHLTRYVEKKWKRDMTWQTIDAHLASVDDLLETPVLFISGSGPFQPTDKQKQNLLEYVNRGGFIFAEACDGEGCDGETFDRDFRQVMQELFKAEFRVLEKEHIIWYAEEKVIPSADRPLLGISACCRTSIVYCPKTLSCYWELGRPVSMSDYPKPVQESIHHANAIGVNVLAYATNRKLREKLQPKIDAGKGPSQNLARGVLSVPKLRHKGGSDEASNALTNILDQVQKETVIRISTKRHLLAASDARLLDYPLAFMHGLRNFEFNASEQNALKAYLERGGMLFADSICSSPQFTKSFQDTIAEMFPDAKLVRIPTEHPLFTQEFRGFDIRRVTLRKPELRGGDKSVTVKTEKVAPLLQGLEIDGRLAVIFSPYDISCAMENQASLECEGYTRQDAIKICINVFLYALQQ